MVRLSDIVPPRLIDDGLDDIVPPSIGRHPGSPGWLPGGQKGGPGDTTVASTAAGIVAAPRVIVPTTRRKPINIRPIRMPAKGRT